MAQVILGHQDLQEQKEHQVKMVSLGQLDRKVNQVNQALEFQGLVDTQDFLVKRVMEDYLVFQETLVFQVQRVHQAFKVFLVCRVCQALLVLQVQLWKVLKATLGPKVLLADQVLQVFKVYQVQKVPVVSLEMEVLKEKEETQAHPVSLACQV